MIHKVKSLSAVELYISTHGMPLVQSDCSVGTNCRVKIIILRLILRTRWVVNDFMLCFTLAKTYVCFSCLYCVITVLGFFWSILGFSPTGLWITLTLRLLSLCWGRNWAHSSTTRSTTSVQTNNHQYLVHLLLCKRTHTHTEYQCHTSECVTVLQKLK